MKPLSFLTSSATSLRHFALLGGLRKEGVWPVPEQIVAVAVVGGANLDLTASELPPTVEIVKCSLVGGLAVRVPAGVLVEFEGFSLIGPRTLPPALSSAPGMSTVRIKAYGLFGGVRVTRC